MDPDVLCDAVRPLIAGNPDVLGAFEAKLPSAGDQGAAYKTIVAWSAEEAFVFAASPLKGRPTELLGRMPLVSAMLSIGDAIAPWDGSTIVVSGASYTVRERHTSEADRFCKAWRAAMQRLPPTSV